MLIQYITDLLGEVPQCLFPLVYFLSFILVLFSLWMVVQMITTVFHKFF